MNISRGKLTSLLVLMFLLNIYAQDYTTAKAEHSNVKQITTKLTTESDFILIVLPDTQYYTENADGDEIEMFDAQTKWIAANYLDSNVVFVAHLGDVVQHDDDIEEEWIRADTVMKKLENIPGLPEGIPYGIDVGNHDQSSWGNPDSPTLLYNNYFGSSRFIDRSYYGGHYGDNNDDHYNLFEVGSLKFIVVFLEYNAFEANGNPLGWASDMLSLYADRFAIVVCHSLLVSEDGTNIDFTEQGQAVFDSLKGNPNLFLMLCGHYSHEGSRVDTNSAGKNVYTLLSDYQGTHSGDGWMRLMKFSPSLNKIFVMTYSPRRSDGSEGWRTGTNSQFTLNYNFYDDPTPVELVDFSGQFKGSEVTLDWKTATEVKNFGFVIERSIDNIQWEKIGFMQGYGSSNVPHLYAFSDKKLTHSGNYYYRLKQIDNDGSYAYSNVIVVYVILPGQYFLEQNYPNPFNPATTIKFSIPLRTKASIKIFDILGREVTTLLNEHVNTGTHSVQWNGKNKAGTVVPSGVYFYKLTAGNFSKVKKMNFLR